MAKTFATLAPKKVRFSYSTADQPVLQRAVIQAIEKMGGQRKLKKLYVQHQKNLKDGQNFFDSALRLLRMKLDYDEAVLARTPKTGPPLWRAGRYHPHLARHQGAPRHQGAGQRRSLPGTGSR
ncbi:MAG: hypothetical protein NTZ54_17090 [Alphaproteobacteria bacterium]|nr:hypothetical protein [Alphaproteobacteria bacterium]